MEIVLAAANTIDIEKSHIEPNGRIKRSILIHTQPGQLVVKNLGIFIRCEVTIPFAAVGDHLTNAVDKLFDRMLPQAGLDITIEVFARHDLCRQLAQGYRDLDIILLENRLPTVAGNPDRTVLPFELLEGMLARG